MPHAPERSLGAAIRFDTPARHESFAPNPPMTRQHHQLTPEKGSAAANQVRLSGWKLWRMRLLVLLGTPAIVFALAEVILRVAGIGHPTAFLLPFSHNGTETLVQNNQFGWRFFGARMARTPHPISIPGTKREGTVRIFVLGESAAYGDPQPRFGLPRVLHAMLSLRYPGTRFEVVNAAMTGINSHVLLPLARDCARADGDIWVIYMGNNEVVGPFGAGTVFGAQTPPLSVIRAGLALRTTRIGQALDLVRQRWTQAPSAQGEWGGMSMFLDQQVRADDTRLSGVHRHFERNLADLIQAGQKAGVGVVVSTVAVNLKDCAPFASAHRPGLSESDRAKWEQLVSAGIAAEQAGRLQEAATQFRQAASIDDQFAELRFRQARVALALGETSEAQRHFQAARDLDALRFRCDTVLNDLIRRQAAGREAERVLFADVERAFAAQSADGVPGSDLFYEHVHLTFRGNHLLAQTIADQVEKLLPARVVARGVRDRPWPSLAECSGRLARTDRDEAAALSEILTRLTDAPFTAQLDHEARVRRWTALLGKLPAADSAEVINNARLLCEQAVAATPDDPSLQGQLAALRRLAGDLAGATAAARRALDLMPGDAEAWSNYGLLLAEGNQFEDAAAAFRRAFEWDAQDVSALQNLAQALTRLNRPEEAIREYRRALAFKPGFGPAWLGLGQLLEAQGRAAEAEECYRRALANRLRRARDLTTLARFCQGRGWLEAASTNYADAIRLNPADATLRLEAGQNLAALGRRVEAAQRYAEAVQIAPNLAQAHFLYGLELGRAGDPAQAAREFREAVRLLPNLLEARLNLGIALAEQGQTDEAVRELEWVLQRNPTNATALRYLEALRPR
jgi:tetratricopeptide (TPR) repeat protein